MKRFFFQIVVPIIKSYTTLKNAEVTKISDSWTGQQGLLLKVEQGKASI
ncbi:hypothetical protein [Enterococcus faecalis]|nr:hypothetical protein [Enterococcus faecalis]MEB7776250.1 hypothetical protein [Enterococcus faecalis]